MGIPWGLSWRKDRVPLPRELSILVTVNTLDLYALGKQRSALHAF